MERCAREMRSLLLVAVSFAMVLGLPWQTNTASGLRETMLNPQWSVFIAPASALVPVCRHNVWVGGNCGTQHHHSDINSWWELNEVQYCSSNVALFCPHLIPPLFLCIVYDCLLICLWTHKCSLSDCYFHGPLALSRRMSTAFSRLF